MHVHSKHMVRAAGLLAALAMITGCTNSERDSTTGGQGALPQTGGEQPGAAQSGGANPAPASDPNHKTVALKNAQGADVGTVDFAQSGGKVVITVTAHNLPPGFHGFHIHNVGKCEAPSEAPGGGGGGNAASGPFLSAGSHYQAPGHTEHPMSGDLTNLYISGDGSGSLTVVTDAVTLAQLAEGKGASIVIHEKVSNFANIPADRYKSAQEGGQVPDETSMNTGDAGGRIACGVIAPPTA